MFKKTIQLIILFSSLITIISFSKAISSEDYIEQIKKNLQASNYNPTEVKENTPLAWEEGKKVYKFLSELLVLKEKIAEIEAQADQNDTHINLKIDLYGKIAELYKKKINETRLDRALWRHDKELSTTKKDNIERECSELSSDLETLTPETIQIIAQKNQQITDLGKLITDYTTCLYMTEEMEKKRQKEMERYIADINFLSQSP